MKDPQDELSPEDGDQIIEDLRDALYGPLED